MLRGNLFSHSSGVCLIRYPFSVFRGFLFKHQATVNIASPSTIRVAEYSDLKLNISKYIYLLYEIPAKLSGVLILV